MNKTIKIIDLINKIANEEEVPENIKWRDKIWIYCKKEQDYINNNVYFFEGFNQIRTKDFITDTVEIIEDEDINIQDIEELNELSDCEERNLKINDLIKAVKKLDKEIRR